MEATFEHYLATRAIETLERYAADVRNQEKPFFLALHFFGPHLPYILPDEYFDLVDPSGIDLPRSVAETFQGKPRSSGTTAPTGRSTPCRSRPRAS